MILAVIAPLLAGCLPPLIRGAQAVGGNVPSCPRSGLVSDVDFQHGNPDLGQRLLAKHPDGSKASALVIDLRRQGFELQGACPTDASVRWAMHRSWLGQANVYWKTDPAENLIWTRGYVEWDGL
jgi:hypothetical protein